jgi:hypothetical protein
MSSDLAQHTFPLDYRSAEIGSTTFSLTTKFIDFFAKIGWADDLKTVSADVILKRSDRTGDGSRVVKKKLEKSRSLLNTSETGTTVFDDKLVSTVSGF